MLILLSSVVLSSLAVLVLLKKKMVSKIRVGHYSFQWVLCRYFGTRANWAQSPAEISSRRFSYSEISVSE
jgi:hypothetical protein